MSSASLPKVGDTLAGKYLIERKIGEGGMGAVYAARNVGIDKLVALKVMLPETGSQEAVARFQNEARNAAKIDSDHVVRVEDHGIDNGLHYMVLELLDGRDLAQIGEETYRAGRRIEPHVAVGWVLQALKGLSVAHAKQIVHRDLKPSNLFLAKKADGNEVIKVLDFGISKSQQGALGQAPSALTSTKAMLGSPLYVAPEQVRSSKGVDHRVDIWAMGVILYELLTGHPPFMGEHLGELFAQIIEEKPIPITQRSPGVSPQLEAIVMRCLEKRPEGRYQTVAELAQALQPFAHPMLMGTVAMGGPSPFSYAGGAFVQTPPGAAPVPPQFVQTPGSMPGMPPGAAMTPPNMVNPMGAVGAITGSGVHPPVVKSPSGRPGEWQSTTGGGVVAKKSLAVPILIGVFVMLGVVGVGLLVAKSKAGAGPTAANAPTGIPSSIPEPPPIPSAVVAPPPGVASAAPPPAVSSVAPPPPAPAPVAVGAKTNTGHGTRPTTTPATDPPKTVAVDPPKPPPPAPAPAPSPKSTGQKPEESR